MPFATSFLANRRASKKPIGMVPTTRPAALLLKLIVNAFATLGWQLRIVNWTHQKPLDPCQKLYGASRGRPLPSTPRPLTWGSREIESRSHSNDCLTG